MPTSDHDANEESKEELTERAKLTRQDTLENIAAQKKAEQDALLQKHKSMVFQRTFRLGPNEVLKDDYSCAMAKTILLQGRLYVSESYIGFFSNLFGFVTQELFSTSSVTRIEKKKTALVVPNAIEIATEEGSVYFFASFLTRDITYDLLCEVCHQVDGSRDCESVDFLGNTRVVDIEEPVPTKDDLDESKGDGLGSDETEPGIAGAANVKPSDDESEYSSEYQSDAVSEYDSMDGHLEEGSDGSAEPASPKQQISLADFYGVPTSNVKLSSPSKNGELLVPDTYSLSDSESDKMSPMRSKRSSSSPLLGDTSDPDHDLPSDQELDLRPEGAEKDVTMDEVQQSSPKSSQDEQEAPEEKSQAPDGEVQKPSQEESVQDSKVPRVSVDEAYNIKQALASPSTLLPEFQGVDMTEIVSVSFPIDVHKFFESFFADDAQYSLADFYTSAGGTEISITNWGDDEDANGRKIKARVVKFRDMVKNPPPFTAKTTRVEATHRYRRLNNNIILMDVRKSTLDIQFCDYFVMHEIWRVVNDVDHNSCQLTVSYGVKFVKSCWASSIILRRSTDENRDALEKWWKHALDAVEVPEPLTPVASKKKPKRKERRRKKKKHSRKTVTAPPRPKTPIPPPKPSKAQLKKREELEHAPWYDRGWNSLKDGWEMLRPLLLNMFDVFKNWWAALSRIERIQVIGVVFLFLICWQIYVMYLHLLSVEGMFVTIVQQRQEVLGEIQTQNERLDRLEVLLNSLNFHTQQNHLQGQETVELVLENT